MGEQTLVLPDTLPKARPWLRFWARNFDLLIHALAIGIIWTILHEESLDRIPDTAFSVLIGLMWAFLEWGYLVKFGTTPGKKIMGIQIRNRDGSRPMDKWIMLKRCRLVWLRGTGLGISIIQIIANIVAYDNVKKHSTTTWDRDLDLVVTYKPISLMRMLICPVFVIVFMLLTIVVSLPIW